MCTNQENSICQVVGTLKRVITRYSICFWLIFTMCCLNSHAQKHDNIWILGYPPNLPEEYFGGTIIDFGMDTVHPTFFDIPFTLLANAVLCDASGTLVAYTNGCSVADGSHEIMTGGDGINPGIVSDIYCDAGYPESQGVLFVPVDTGKYRLLHLRRGGDAFRVQELLFSELEFSEEHDQWIVTKKNVQGAYGPFSDGLTAVQHANGRDWWIVEVLLESNAYVKVISSPSGVEVRDTQIIGSNLGFSDGASQITFSPDGRYFVRADNIKGLLLFGFDRCTGELFNDEILITEGDSIVPNGVAFSRSSRFLYVSAFTEVYQFDLEAPNIVESRTLVAEYDGFEGPLPTTFFQQMLAPDDKIYITATNSVRYLHVINHPERKGVDCALQQHAIELPSLHAFSVPNMPHYRLGPEEGSECDSLLTTVKTPDHREPVSFEVFPNPAQDVLNFRLNPSTRITNEIEVHIYSTSGVLVFSQKLQEFDKSISIDLPGGLYTCILRDAQKTFRPKRFVVMN